MIGINRYRIDKIRTGKKRKSFNAWLRRARLGVIGKLGNASKYGMCPKVGSELDKMFQEMSDKHMKQYLDSHPQIVNDLLRELGIIKA